MITGQKAAGARHSGPARPALSAHEARRKPSPLATTELCCWATAASRITVPVEFLLQWDDEAVPRDAGLALFDAFASREKMLHAHAGRHASVPAFEVESSERFFARAPRKWRFRGGRFLTCPGGK